MENKLPYKYRSIYENNDWRKSSHSTLDKAIYSDTRGSIALVSGKNKDVQNDSYGKLLFIVIFGGHEGSEMDNAVVIKPSLSSHNGIERCSIPLDVALSFEKNRKADLEYLEEAFDSSNDIDPKLYDDINQCYENATSTTEKQQLIRSRIGQGRFRRNVIKTWGMEQCAITLISTREVLIASHIKAWSDSKDNDEGRKERLDGANGILLCAHLDKLFDRYLITFEKVKNEYRLKMSSQLNKKELMLLGINEGIALAIGRMKPSDFERFETFLLHHQSRFKK